MRAQDMADGALSFDMRLLQHPTERVNLRTDCGYLCSGEMNISHILEAANRDARQRATFPMKCFA